MTRRAVWSRRAERDLRALEAQVASRIQLAIDRYVDSGHGDVRRLRGARERAFRLRVGDYRVIFTVAPEAGDEIIRILQVRHRRDVYRS